MKVAQIKTILNDVFGEILGEGNLFTEDLSNIVSAGQIITTNTDFGANFDNYAKAIVDKVGRVVFVNRVYEKQDLGIWRDAWDYGSVLEKIRVEVNDFTDNNEWKLTDESGNGESDYNDSISTNVDNMFKFYPAKVRAKYFNYKTTFRCTISIAEKQLRSAFRSASDMARFIGMIEQRINTKMEIAKDQLQRKVLANFMGVRILGGGATCVDLKTDYHDATGETAPATLELALHDEKFVKYMAERIKKDRKLMAAPSAIYSGLDDGFYNFTPREDARLIVLDDVDTALSFYLYADAYHNEFVTLDGYRTLPFWQGSGTGMRLTDRSALDIITTEGDDYPVNRTGIVGVLFDRDAIMICNDEPEVTYQYNPDGRFTNFFYAADCSYYNDMDENGIVYVYGAGATDDVSRGDFGISLAVGTSNVGDTKATVASGTTGTLKGKVYDPEDVPFVEVGSALDVTGFASFTAGTAKTLGTSDGVEAGAVLLVVALDANSKVTGSATITIPADKIKAS